MNKHYQNNQQNKHKQLNQLKQTNKTTNTMKKLLLFLALAAAGLQAWAGDKYPTALYVVGNATSFDWGPSTNPANAPRLFKTSEKEYEGFVKFNETNGELKFLVTNAYNQGQWGAVTNGTSITESSIRTEYESVGDGSANHPDKKFRFNLDLGLYLVRVNLTTEGSETITFTKWNISDSYSIGSSAQLSAYVEGHNKVDTSIKFAISTNISADSNIVYEISTSSDLQNFSSLVNGGAGSLNGKLTTNIDMNGVTGWTPIGQDQKDYKGHFDGQGYRILNLTTSTGYNNQALFGQAVGGAIIENVIIDASCTIQGAKWVAGILGHVWGDGVIVRNCGNEANVNGTGDTCAGIVGCSEKIVYISNCYNTGNITGSKWNAGICGWMGNESSTIKNCYSTGTVSGSETEPIWRKDLDEGNAANNYTTFDGQGTKVKSSQVSSGELCYMLNGNQTSINWYQNLSGTVDNHPVPLSSHSQVYANGTLRCDKCLLENETYTYNNTFGSTPPPHTYSDGWCSVCNAYQENGITAINGWFEIGNAKQLRWMAESVNEHNSTYGNANIKLTGNIDYSAYTDQAAMIGKPSNTFKGVFDGQCHTVTVAFDNTTANETGLFRRVNGGTIQNLKVAGTITTNKQFAGGIVSGIWERGTITNCESAVTMTDTSDHDGTHGGILGWIQNKVDVKVQNCIFSGTLNLSNCTGCAGVVGWTQDANEVKVQNCLVTGSLNLKDADSNGIIVRSSCDCSNNYYTSSVSGSNIKTTGGTVAVSGTPASGELCYLLNDNTSGGTNWYQTLAGTDAHPYPFNTHKQVYQISESSYTNLPVADGKVQISSADDLDWFGHEVGAGNTAMNAELTRDINSYSGWYIGSAEHYYTGTFDGKAHKISVYYDKSTEEKIGLFQHVDGGTIQNLIVDGTIIGNKFMAGLVNVSKGTTTIQNVVVDVDITSSYSGDGTHGGVISVAEYGSIPSINNVAFTGSIYAPNSYGTCGIIGYAHWGGDITYRNCYVSGTLTLTGDNNRVFGRNGEYCENCYTTLGMTKLNNSERFNGGDVTSEQVENGELCYLLNSSTCYDAKWFQNLSGTTDSYPVPFNTHGIVNKISSVGYTTQYIPTTDVIIPEGVEAYAGVISGERLSLRAISGAINKEDAVVLKGTANTYYSFVPTTGASKATNNLLGSDGNATGGANIYALANLTPEGETDPVVGFYRFIDDTKNIPAGKAYLEYTAPSPVKGFTFVFDDDATSLSSISSPEGKECIYNLAGQRVNKMQKGINIVNGKKVMVK